MPPEQDTSGLVNMPLKRTKGSRQVESSLAWLGFALRAEQAPLLISRHRTRDKRERFEGEPWLCGN